jgi:hypothetical protein
MEQTVRPLLEAVTFADSEFKITDPLIRKGMSNEFMELGAIRKAQRLKSLCVHPPTCFQIVQSGI